MLATFLHCIRDSGVLQRLRKPHRLLGHLLAGLLQLGRQSDDLRPVLQGLSIRLQANHLPVLLRGSGVSDGEHE